MKLYTEEQVREILKDTTRLSTLGISLYISELTPIELPSDEEIEKYVLSHKYDDMFENLIIQGAKWVIEQIKQQDNA